MPEFDRRPVNRKRHGGRRTVARRKENIAVSILRGLFPWKGDKGGDIVRKLILLGSLALLIWAGMQIVDYYILRDIRTDRERAELVRIRIDYDSEEYLLMHIPGFPHGSDLVGEQVQVIGEYLEFYEMNDDFVGWLEIYPIVQYPVYQYREYNEDGVRIGNNDFYLNHNHERWPTTNGTIFTDWEGRFTPDERPHTTIVYGHNLQTKNLFQPLLNYRPNNTSSMDSFEFLKLNPTIVFDTLYERGNYKIFAVIQTNVERTQGDVFHYWDYVYFRNKPHFDNFVADILDMSMYYTNVDIEYGDELLMLSTCDFSVFSNGADSSVRLVVVARRVRDNEFAGFTEAEIDAFIDNRGVNEDGQLNRKMFEAYYNLRYPAGWAGRSWDPDYIKDFDNY
ncbi:MAG: class B sortase [Oscillospiraceae bacterium]|nr:class B sortase [Oscillospiraceae bacterium]